MFTVKVLLVMGVVQGVADTVTDDTVFVEGSWELLKVGVVIRLSLANSM